MCGVELMAFHCYSRQGRREEVRWGEWMDDDDDEDEDEDGGGNR